jgi:rod shape determining protein RodA
LPRVAVELLGRDLRLQVRRDEHPLRSLLRHVDLTLVLVALALSGIGAVMVYSATRAQLVAAGVDPHYFLVRQLVYVALGVVVMVVAALFDYRRYEQWGYLLYGLVVLSLVAVLTHVGRSALGSQRWFQLGPIQLQPSEFGALALVVAVALYLAHHYRELTFRRLLVVLALAGVPMLLVAKQPDLGTAIIMGVVLAAMLVVAGAKLRYLVLLGLSVVAAFLAALHFGLLHHYQLERLTGFLHQNQGAEGQNYNLAMSKTTISLGGLTGTGLFHGAETNLGYVPEQSTDFIFTAVGEQLGFVGSAVVLGLFALMALRMLRALQSARDPFGRLLCAGALAFIVFSVFENVGMTIGLMPIAGIPLPFLSYGGSALLAFFATVGIVLNVEMRRHSFR